MHQPLSKNSTHPETGFFLGGGEYSEWPFSWTDFGICREMFYEELEYILPDLCRRSEEMAFEAAFCLFQLGPLFQQPINQP